MNFTIEPLSVEDRGPDVNDSLGAKLLAQIIESLTPEEAHANSDYPRRRVTVPKTMSRNRVKAAITHAVKRSPYFHTMWNHDTDPAVFYIELRHK